jgi:hypothetical protein
MSGECEKCGEHCLDCKCAISEILNKTLREHIEECIKGLDHNMMFHYKANDEADSKEWHYNHGCVYAFSLAKGALEACLRLEDRKNGENNQKTLAHMLEQVNKPNEMRCGCGSIKAKDGEPFTHYCCDCKCKLV